MALTLVDLDEIPEAEPGTWTIGFVHRPKGNRQQAADTPSPATGKGEAEQAQNGKDAR
ncbi:MAG: hypothetical protein ACYC7E_18220 [Armatimonadota bacterium]